MISEITTTTTTTTAATTTSITTPATTPAATTPAATTPAATTQAATTPVPENGADFNPTPICVFFAGLIYLIEENKVDEKNGIRFVID